MIGSVLIGITGLIFTVCLVLASVGIFWGIKRSYDMWDFYDNIDKILISTLMTIAFLLYCMLIYLIVYYWIEYFKIIL